MPTLPITQLTNTDQTKTISFEEIHHAVRNNNFINMADYTALRAYSGDAEFVFITEDGLAGNFKRLDSSTLPDNGGTTLVDNNGRRWSRIIENGINIKWFGAQGDGTTDDSKAIINAIHFINSLGGNNKLIIPDGVFGLSETCRPTSNITIEFIGWLKCLARPSSNLDTLLLPANGASNLLFINPKIDMNNIPAMNGFMFRTGNSNCHSVGGHIKNGVHAKDLTQGGRGFNLESNATVLNNKGCTVTGLKITNCYMGFSVQGGQQNNRNNFIIDNISIDTCDVAFWLVGNTAGYPHSSDEMQVIISNITWRNCGINTQYPGQDGAIVMDRASNIMMTNIAGHTSPDYGILDAILRGNCSKVTFSGVFIGDATNAISFSPYKESTTIVPFEHSVQDSDIVLDIHGTVTDFIKNTPSNQHYIMRSNVQGSATTIHTKRAINTHLAGFDTLRIDLLERTSNARILGPADAVDTTLFTTFPGRKIDMDLAKTGPLQSTGDIASRAFTPTFTLHDLSANSKDFRIAADGNAFSINTDQAINSGLFDKKIYEHNEAKKAGSFFIDGLAVFSYDESGPKFGTFVPDAIGSSSGHITIKDASGVIRKIAIIP